MADASSTKSFNKVEFFQGTQKNGEDTTAPCSFTWGLTTPGNYSLTSKATGSSGAATTSSAVAVNVAASRSLDSASAGAKPNILDESHASVQPWDPSVGTIEIFNSSGQEVRSLSAAEGWDGKNSDGKRVVLGIYIATNSSRKHYEMLNLK